MGQLQSSTPFDGDDLLSLPDTHCLLVYLIISHVERGWSVVQLFTALLPFLSSDAALQVTIRTSNTSIFIIPLASNLSCFISLSLLEEPVKCITFIRLHASHAVPTEIEISETSDPTQMLDIAYYLRCFGRGMIGHVGSTMPDAIAY